MIIESFRRSNTDNNTTNRNGSNINIFICSNITPKDNFTYPTSFIKSVSMFRAWELEYFINENNSTISGESGCVCFILSQCEGLSNSIKSSANIIKQEVFIVSFISRTCFCRPQEYSSLERITSSNSVKTTAKRWF